MSSRWSAVRLRKAAVFLKFTALTVRRGAGFHSNNASRVLREEREQLSSRNLFTEYDGSIDARAVQMKNALCKIDPDDANFGHGCSLLL
jgi:hypothetical protein